MQRDVPINRTLVGCLSLGCLAAALAIALFSRSSSNDMWQGAFLKVGVVLGALWVALPNWSADRPFATASLWHVMGVLLGLVMLIRLRIPLQLLVPLALVTAFAIRVLRPKPKTRPPRPRREY